MRVLVKDTPLIDREIRRKKEKRAQLSAGIELTTSMSQGMLSTTVLQPLPGTKKHRKTQKAAKSYLEQQRPSH